MRTMEAMCGGCHIVAPRFWLVVWVMHALEIRPGWALFGGLVKLDGKAIAAPPWELLMGARGS